MADRIYEPITFENNITPLNERNLNQLSGNIDYVYNVIKGLVPNSSDRASPLPDASGDGLIRYVLSVKEDMIYTQAEEPPHANGRYFVAVPDEVTNRWHLEVWNYNGGWDVKDVYTTRKGEDSAAHYTDHAWDACTHDKLFICENTNKCYRMISPYGSGNADHIDSGTTKQSANFMIEAAQSAKTIMYGNGVRQGKSQGIAHSELLRYRILIMNFHLYGADSKEITVAFNLWWNINSIIYVPFQFPLDVDAYGNTTNMTSGMLKIYDNNNKFTISASYWNYDNFDTTRPVVLHKDVEVYIDYLVGVADIRVDT